MYPILLKIGPLTVHTYGVLVASGFFIAYLLSLQLAKQDGFSEGLVTDIAWVSLLGGLLGARILYVAFNWELYRHSLLSILKIWEGGLVFYGGLIGGALAGTLFVRHRRSSVGSLADVFVPALALGQAIGRVGCFAAGCCYGKTSGAPWAVTYKSLDSLGPLGVPIHPSQLYEAVLLLALCAALVLSRKKLRDVFGPGGAALLYVEMYSVVRLIVEFTRGDDRGPVFYGLTSTQWLAIVLFAAASAGNAFLLIRKKTGSASV